MAIADLDPLARPAQQRGTDLVTAVIAAVALVTLSAFALAPDRHFPAGISAGADPAPAEEQPSEVEDDATQEPRRDPPGQPPPDWPVPDGWTKLTPKDQCWIHRADKQVLVGGNICLTRGVLEMFACPRHTKEHESIVSVDSMVQIVHAALLAVGAKPGHPVRYQPAYEPAEGSIIDIDVLWRDKHGKEQRRPAKEMVMNVKTGKALEHDWVFGGSLFLENPQTKDRFYQAEGGEFICVSNFGSATLDLPIDSSDAESQLMFKAFTENIPAENTPVRLLLKPREPAGAK